MSKKKNYQHISEGEISEETVDEVLEILDEISEAIIDQACKAFKEGEDVKGGIQRFFPMEGVDKTQLTWFLDWNRDVYSQKSRIKVLEAFLEYLIRDIDPKGAWEAPEVKEDKEKKQMIIHSIRTVLEDWGKVGNDVANSDYVKIWREVGLFILGSVSGTHPLNIKDSIASWVLPVIGASSQCIVNTLYSCYVCDRDSHEFSTCQEPFFLLKDIMKGDKNPIGRPGFLYSSNGHLTADENYTKPTFKPELRFYEIVRAIHTKKEIFTLSESPIVSIVDVFLDTVLFSEQKGDYTLLDSSYAEMFCVIIRKLEEKGLNAATAIIMDILFVLYQGVLYFYEEAMGAYSTFLRATDYMIRTSQDEDWRRRYQWRVLKVQDPSAEMFRGFAKDVIFFGESYNFPIKDYITWHNKKPSSFAERDCTGPYYVEPKKKSSGDDDTEDLPDDVDEKPYFPCTGYLS